MNFGHIAQCNSEDNERERENCLLISREWSLEANIFYFFLFLFGDAVYMNAFKVIVRGRERETEAGNEISLSLRVG